MVSIPVTKNRDFAIGPRKVRHRDQPAVLIFHVEVALPISNTESVEGSTWWLIDFASMVPAQRLLRPAGPFLQHLLQCLSALSVRDRLGLDPGEFSRGNKNVPHNVFVKGRMPPLLYVFAA